MESTVILSGKITFQTRAPHAHDGGSPEYTAAVDGKWVGLVYRCPWDIAPAPVCFCKGWHGATHTVKLPVHQNVNVTGFSTRKDAARALNAVRQAWAQAGASNIS